MSDHNRTRLSEFDYFPVFVDYDFEKSRVRGGSVYFDFFSFGRLSSVMDEVNDQWPAFISMDGILPDKGFFLVDFAQAATKPDELFSVIKKLNLSRIYVEDSVRHPLGEVLSGLDGVSVSYVNFVA